MATDVRTVHIILPDDDQLEVIVQPKLYTYELLNLVSSHKALKEKNYFGLSYRDESGHYQWLQLERRVFDHDYPKKIGLITLYFAVKFYVENILTLPEIPTILMYYLQSRQSIYKGLLETDSETIFELSAYILQITCGNLTSESECRQHIKQFSLSRKILEEYPSLTYCEDQIIGFYRKLAGHTFGTALINYMSIVESLPTYGVHYYAIKDKVGVPWWLGISGKGLMVFDILDKKIPRKFYPWASLENLYFRDKKFIIEVLEASNVSSNNNNNSNLEIVVHTWLATSTQLARSIWMMAVNQHQFYLDRKHFKVNVLLLL
ncbi:hypothetical protein HELRODRAFT_110730 [Helobdella robusta]|uniref:FERM domain-containing protein n=1 Tax=Helobdella robusta TaxID=6412 RepID=T1EF47_HELRO|nr:hypothetical protein HELRODRAFT_110730 [Helobdella robusta]ESO07214.1 hypothetical protein HELRODRAFT_110730 [Helobdella robusta]